MNQKKTMKLWQMLVIVILSAAMLVTIFLPAFHINGDAAVRMYKKIPLSSEAREDADEEMNRVKEECDKYIKEKEEEYGIKISSIMPGRVMTHSFKAFFGEEIEEDDSEIAAGIKSAYNMLRMILWIVYMAVFVVLIIVILGFCLKWTKYIPLAVSAVYGGLAAVAFGIYQFMGPGLMAKTVDAGEMMGLGSLAGVADSMMAEMVSCFWGTAFLIGFIIAILMLVMSVVSMFAGGVPVYTPPVYTPPEHVDFDQQEFERQRQAQLEEERREQEKRERQAQLDRERQEQMKREQAVPVMGRVMCTKGAAAGQGFSLPEQSKVVVGKSNHNANLIISHPHISNIHCSIRYKAATNTYIVKDHSMNGTFVNGVRMQKDVPMEYPAGTTLQLADGSNEITLG